MHSAKSIEHSFLLIIFSKSLLCFYRGLSFSLHRKGKLLPKIIKYDNFPKFNYKKRGLAFMPALFWCLELNTIILSLSLSSGGKVEGEVQ